MKIRDGLAGLGYLIGAHFFDALYGLVSKECGFFPAMGIMFMVLGGTSVLLVQLYREVKRRLGWDVLGLERLNRLWDEKDIPQHRVGRRLTRWLIRRRLTIFVLGSCFIGPPVVTILLRKPGSVMDTAFYILAGTLISVVTWVTVWKGFWDVWALYIKSAVSWVA